MPAPRLSIFAATAPGLERIAEAELRALAIADATAEEGGVAFHGGLAELYRANIWLRTASRVVVRIGEFQVRTFFELERLARRLDWDRVVDATRPVRMRVTCRKSRLYHSGAVEERFLEAIQRRTGATIAPEPREPAGDTDAGEARESTERADEQLIIVRLVHDRATVSADSSGALLHRRGYRQALARAPLRETLAAAMLLGSRWDASAPLLDPMCGAGTIPIEGALIARRIAPGLSRATHGGSGFACTRWPEFDAELWSATVRQAREAVLPAAPGPVLASDRDAGAIAAARGNAERAGVAADMEMDVRPLSAIEPPARPGWLVTNPPYGVRVGERGPLRDLYASLGNLVRRRLPGWTVALLSADRELERQLRLPLEEVLRTENGGIAVRMLKSGGGSSGDAA